MSLKTVWVVCKTVIERETGSITSLFYLIFMLFHFLVYLTYKVTNGSI